jgi:hypothetical protein
MVLNSVQRESTMIQPRKFGGILILVCIAVWISPISILYYLISTLPSTFSTQTWNILTDQSSQVYSPYWAPIFVGEFLYNIIFLLLSVYVMIIMSRKKRNFPKIFAIITIISTAFIFADSYFIALASHSNALMDNERSKEFSISLISCLIWIPYLFLSKRSKQTFINY